MMGSQCEAMMYRMIEEQKSLKQEIARLKSELKERERKAAEIMYQIIYDETYGDFPPIERVMQLWQSEIEKEGK